MYGRRDQPPHVYLCLPSYLPAYHLPTFLPVYISAFLPTSSSTFLSVLLPSCLPVYLPSFLPAFLPTFLPIFLSTPPQSPARQSQPICACSPSSALQALERRCVVGLGVGGIAAFGNAPSALIPATILTAAIGAISAYTFMLIARVCDMTGASFYADAWDKTRGTKTSWVIALSSALDCFMGNLSYSMILADSIRDLLSTFSIATTRTRSLIGVTTLILLPLCLVKNLATLAPFSLLGIIGMAYTSFAIGIRYFGGAYAPGGCFLADIGPTLQPSFGTTGTAGVVSPNSLILVCMLSTAYIAHFNAPRFLRELKDNTMSRFGKVTGISFGISTAIYAVVSAMAFLTFGANCDGLILNNYSTKDLLISESRFAVAISLIFS